MPDPVTSGDETDSGSIGEAEGAADHSPPAPMAELVHGADEPANSWWRDHHVVAVAGVAVGAAGLVVAVIFGIAQLVAGLQDNQTGQEQVKIAESEAARMPNLKVVRVSAYVDGGIEATQVEPGPTEGVTPTPTTVSAAHIDVTFENRAPGPALITAATVRLREAGPLPACFIYGGGLVTTANYDFTVPEDAEMPFTQRKEISFQVKPNELDRLTVTVGQEEPIGTWYGVVDVTFHHDGKDTTVGPFTVISNNGLIDFEVPDKGLGSFGFDGDRWLIDNVAVRGCLDDNAALLDRLRLIPDIAFSQELTALEKALAELGY